MRQGLYRRLQQLETASALARAQLKSFDMKAAQEKARNKFQSFLELRGIERSPKESLMEALARALEMTCREIRELLRNGVDPVHKYFDDHGVPDEIEIRKAAGTRPGGWRWKSQNVRL